MPDQDYFQCCKLPKAKICAKCQTVKEPSEFDKGRKMCKDCRKIYNSKYYQTQKDIKAVDKLKVN